MGFKEKWKLMKRLDQSLLDQAALLGAHPTIEGVYRLQSLADTHCTLKTRQFHKNPRKRQPLKERRDHDRIEKREKSHERYYNEI